MKTVIVTLRIHIDTEDSEEAVDTAGSLEFNDLVKGKVDKIEVCAVEEN